MLTRQSPQAPCLSVSSSITLSGRGSNSPATVPAVQSFVPATVSAASVPEIVSTNSDTATNTGYKRQLETLLGRKWAILSPDYTGPYPYALIKYSIIWTLIQLELLE